MAKHKIPKRIAGVKLNKQLRKRGNELLALADSPQGRETIAVGLGMAAAAVSVALRKRDTEATETPAPAPGPAPGEVRSNSTPFDGEQIAAAVNQTIQSAMARFFGSVERR